MCNVSLERRTFVGLILSSMQKSESGKNALEGSRSGSGASSRAPSGSHVPDGEGMQKSGQETGRSSPGEQKSGDTPQLTRSQSKLLRRGLSATEQKSTWGFDFYQKYGKHDVGYQYWYRDEETDIGDVRLVAMFAQVNLPEGTKVAADQVYHREALAEAHQAAQAKYLEALNRAPPITNDSWTALKARLATTSQNGTGASHSQGRGLVNRLFGPRRR